MKSVYLLLISVFMTFPVFLKSQSILEYERTTFAGTYQQINGTYGPWGDDNAQNVNLPFSLYFIDSYYTEVRICTNGWIELGSSTYPLSYSNSTWCGDLFSPIEPNKSLAPWWFDLGSFNYYVEYTTLGSSPNRVFVVQWRDVNSPYYSSRLINFQVRLYETTNVIEFCYGNVSGYGDYEYAGFGIEDRIGGSGHFIDGPTGSNTSGTTWLNSYDNWPSVFYRFSPAPVRVIKPNGGEYFSISYPDTIKWSAAVNNVKLEYSTDSGNFWNLIESSLPAAQGQYVWDVPNTPTENALVKISDASDPSVFDVSDNVFSIAEPPQISVIPDSITVTINEGDSTELQLQISNSGTGNLYYEISIENNFLKTKKILKTQPNNPFSDWRANSIRSRERRVKGDNPSGPSVIPPKESLPLIISDPAGDGGVVDITEIRGLAGTDSITLQLVFETELNVYDFAGFIGFDTDQDINTGVMYPNGIFTQTVGCEYFAEMYNVAYNQIYIYDQNYNYVGNYPAQYDLHNVIFSIPLSVLGNDDGIMNLAAVVGNYNSPTDWIPDQGCGILGGNLWLNVHPLSGVINPGSNEDIQVKISTESIDGGEYYANLLISSNDPVNQMVTVPVHLTVIAQPDLSAPDSCIYNQVYVGFPVINYLNLRNNGSADLNVSDIQFSNNVFSVEGNTAFTISPSSSYQLSVKFEPTGAGIEAGTLDILSNDPSSPFVIDLSGEGIFPPAISVSPDSFFFDLNVGDSVNTQFIIDNSNGLGELTFQISDKFIAGKIIKRNPHQDILKIKKPKEAKFPMMGVDLFNHLKADNRKRTAEIPKKTKAGKSMLTLPLIIQDNIGDGGEADIKELRGQILYDNLEFEFVFADNINITSDFIAILYLDIDRDPLTGATDPYYCHDLGVEYVVVYEPYYFGSDILIIEYSSGYSFTVPCIISGSTISYSIPLSILGNDDGDMDMVAISGLESYGITDWAPNESHATLFGDVSWLNENPISGTIPAGGSLAIEVNANTSELIGGNILTDIELRSNDPAHPVTEIPFNLHLTGIPQLSVSPDTLNFGEIYIGYSGSLSVSISSTGTDSLVGTLALNDPEFILADSVFALPVGGIKNFEVQYHPLDTGFTAASLTINTNGGSETIFLTGMGLIPPNIVTSATSMQFISNCGEVLDSGFTIYNSGGSNLNVQINDEMFLGADQRLFGSVDNVICEINTETGAVLNSFSSPVNTGYYTNGLAFSGDKLFYSSPDYSTNIFVLNPENGTIISGFPSNCGYCSGLAFIDPYLYAYDSYNNCINILNALNGNVVRTIYPSVYISGDIDGGDDRLFVSDGYMIYELNINNGSVKNSFYAVNSTYGMGFTGASLFTTYIWAGIDEYDPDTGEFRKTLSTSGYTALAGAVNRDAKWIVEDPIQVSIPAGDSSYISLNICSQDTGHLSASILLQSNDPAAPVVTIPVVLDVLTGVLEGNTVPTEYSLYYNYPNPFNPSTTIKYDLPRQSNVSLKIYDILGEEVAALVNSEQMAGRYKVTWNADRFASGIYIYRIQAGDFVAVKKMILVK